MAGGEDGCGLSLAQLREESGSERDRFRADRVFEGSGAWGSLIRRIDGQKGCIGLFFEGLISRPS